MPPTEEDLAWLRSTFHPIPKPRLPDDCVEYSLYLFDRDIDLKDDSRSRPRLREALKHAADLQKQYLKDYIWQRQTFKLEFAKEDGVTLLRGQTEYGDSVEDEWAIVWLLRELTKKFQDLAVKVNDNDGEFLLVEAAGTLPEWLEPETAGNRVWIHRGRLIIIKPESIKLAKQGKGSLALSNVRDTFIDKPGRLLKSVAIEEEAFYRLRNYPSQISQNMHNALLTIPRKLCFLLHQKPAYIAPAIEAFYLRDPIALKPLQAKSKGQDLILQPDDLVTISVRFPRVGYAQLRSQDFPVPAIWTGKLPLKSQEPSFAQAEMGLKLCSGFEMLLSDPQNQDKPAVREMKMLLTDLESGDETLPSDKQVQSWPRLQDDEKWLDISFEDLEEELAAKSNKTGKKKAQFGDKQAQENLQRIVSHFEAFLNDDKAGPDGAGFFQEVSDGSEPVDDEETDSDDDGDDALNDERLNVMMREMMGMPPGSKPLRNLSKPNDQVSKAGPSRVTELDSDGEDNEEDLASVMQRMKNELDEHGALDLHPDAGRLDAGETSFKGKKPIRSGKLSDEETGNIDANLARNLLESLKGQAGGPGPGGNMIGLMGLKMPRDEPDTEGR